MHRIGRVEHVTVCTITFYYTQQKGDCYDA
jgi:hypothetical protein